MFKSIPLGACLVCMAALIGAGAVSARAGATSYYTLGAANGVQSADAGLNVPASLLPTIWSSQINLGSEHLYSDDRGGRDGEDEHRVGKSDHDGDKGGDGGKDGENEEGKPAPTPEPSTMLSFAAALVIGGSVFLLGRLRKERR